MFQRPRWSARFAALAASTAIAVSACGAAATPAPTTAPSQAASQAASQSTAPSAAAFTPASWPATAVDCANKPKDYTGEISQIKAVDQYTVEFDLCASDVAFLSKIAFTSNNIQDSDWLKAHAADKSLVKTTNGTGPYMVTEWVKGDHVNLAVNPNYWGTAAKAPKLVVKWSTEAAQRLQELQAGTVDGIDNVGPDDFDKVQADSNLKLYLRQALNNLYLGFNMGDAPWDNEAVRQAIGIGLDRKRIADNFYPTGSEAADYFTPCAIPFGCNGDKWDAFDKAKAKQMLVDARFDFSKTYDFHYRTKVRSYLPSPTQVATDIQAQLKDNLGINIKLVVEKDDTYLTDSSKGKFPLFLLGWGADYPDMTDFLDYPLRHRRQRRLRAEVQGPRRQAHRRRIRDGRDQAWCALHGGQQPREEARPDGPARPRWFGDGLQGRRRQRTLVADRQRGALDDDPGHPRHAHLDAELRTVAGSTAATRVTAMRCASASRSSTRCTSTRWPDSRPSPRWPRAAHPAPISRPGPASSARASSSPCRGRSTPTTWSIRTRPSGTPRTRSMSATPAPSITSRPCSVGS